MAGKRQNMAPMWKKLMKNVDILTNQLHFLITYTWDVLNVSANRMKSLLRNVQKWKNPVFLLEQLKNYQVGKSLTQRPSRGCTTWKDMLENALSDIVKIGKQESGATVQSLKPLPGWSSIQAGRTRISVLRCLCLARIGRPDILWSVNKLARVVTKWAQACDRRLERLISYIHHTSDYRQYCHVGNTAQHCRVGLFQDSDSAGDIEDSKSTSGVVLCIFGSRTFVPVSWMCKKRSSVSHSSTESEIISLDAGLRMCGLRALELWDIVIEVLRSIKTMYNPNIQGTRKLGQFLIPKPRPSMSKENRRLSKWMMWIMYSQTHILLKMSLSCTTKLWSGW